MPDIDPKLFVLLMPWGRVGSNLVSASMSGRRRIHIENEPTTRIKTFGIQNQLSWEDMQIQQFEHLESFVQNHRLHAMAVGLKLSHRSLIDPAQYLARLAEHRFAMVLLLRDNFLKCAVSQVRAVARARNPGHFAEKWESPWAVAANEPKPGKMKIDVNLTLRLAAEFAKHHEATLNSVHKTFGAQFMRIEYADLAADPEQTLTRLYAYLGLEAPREILIPHRKATSEDLSKDIFNYEEFERKVRESAFSRFLEK